MPVEETRLQKKIKQQQHLHCIYKTMDGKALLCVVMNTSFGVQIIDFSILVVTCKH